MCLARSEEDGERLSTLGAPNVLVAGDIKFDAPTLPADPWGRAQVRLISRLCDFYLVMAMVPLFTASGQSRTS